MYQMPLSPVVEFSTTISDFPSALKSPTPVIFQSVVVVTKVCPLDIEAPFIYQTPFSPVIEFSTKISGLPSKLKSPSLNVGEGSPSNIADIDADGAEIFDSPLEVCVPL